MLLIFYFLAVFLVVCRRAIWNMARREALSEPVARRDRLRRIVAPLVPGHRQMDTTLASAMGICVSLLAGKIVRNSILEPLVPGSRDLRNH